VVTRYQFLAMLHEVLQPKTYLDIGVQNGHSLALAHAGTTAYAVDPDLRSTGVTYNDAIRATVHWAEMPSDLFFASREVDPMPEPVDFASIDGMHLFEYALRDFMGCEKWAAPGCVVAFDDVSPYSSLIATRVQPPGDWTGDVWKVRPILAEMRPDLTTVLVDTFPTGTLLVWDLDPTNTVLREHYDTIVAKWLAFGETVPGNVLAERGIQPYVAIEMLKRRGT
jgi:methyltransferase family protein